MSTKDPAEATVNKAIKEEPDFDKALPILFLANMKALEEIYGSKPTSVKKDKIMEEAHYLRSDPAKKVSWLIEKRQKEEIYGKEVSEIDIKATYVFKGIVDILRGILPQEEG